MGFITMLQHGKISLELFPGIFKQAVPSWESLFLGCQVKGMICYIFVCYHSLDFVWHINSNGSHYK